MNVPWSLFLDDERPAPAGWTLAKSVAEAQTMVIERGTPNALSLDHDMAWTVPPHLTAVEGPLVQRVSGWFRPGVCVDPTGLDFADWFCEHTIEGSLLPLDFIYYIHTANQRARPMLRDRMFRAIRREPTAYGDWWAR
jgi:hypothetical protein